MERKARVSDVESYREKVDVSVDGEYADDGLTEALNNSAKKVWEEE